MSEHRIPHRHRKSPLAMWQAEHVAEMLRQAHDGLTVEIHGMSTEGDKILDTPLANRRQGPVRQELRTAHARQRLVISRCTR